MKQKLLFNCFAVLFFLFGVSAGAQTGYIYVHLKHINEEASPNYSFTLYNSSGTAVKTFTLNDQAAADNVALSGNYIYVYDIGESHGSGGDGQLWVTGGTAWGSLEASTTLTALSGTLYYRSDTASNWVSTAITGVRNVDGAYANQCVYTTTAGNVVFYNKGTINTIYTGGDAWDVTANGGTIAICTKTGVIKVNTGTYTAGANFTNTGWNSVYTNTSGNDYAQLDMKLAGDTLAYMASGSSNVYKIVASKTTTSTPTSLGSAGTTSNPWDIAYDDDGTLYATATNSSSALIGISSYSASSPTWTYESRSGDVSGVTAGAGHSVFGVQTQLTTPADETIFGRFYDKTTATTYYVDDDRVKNSSSLSGNGIMIPVTPGTYTVVETIPTGYDLGRFNIYDPQAQSSGTVSTNTLKFVVSSDEVVFGEYINEYLVPKSIALTCTFQYLQTFDASNSTTIYTYTYGSATYGTNVSGTAYHYWAQADAHDGYYMLVQGTTNWFNNTGLTDHTGNNGYFMLINASFQADEFYRQRVTNLVPGLQYTIAFYAANVSPTATTLEPNITFGLQDLSGNIVNSATSGNITSSAWTEYTFTFTATTSTADLYMTNNGIGGNGNDLAIDDISINPVYTTLGTNTESPTVAPNLCVSSTYTFSNTVSGGTWSSSNPAVAKIVNTNTGKVLTLSAGMVDIIYTYTNTVGCSSTSTSTLTAVAPPTVSASDKFAGVLCLNSKDSLFAAVSGLVGTPTYTWSASPSTGAGLGSTTTQNTTATPTVSGSYSYIIVVADGTTGCAASSSVGVTVSSNTAPAVTASASKSIACYNTSINLTSTISGGSGWTYAWAGSGVTSPTSPNTTATPTTSGIYTLVVDDNQGCNTFATTGNVTSDPQFTAVPAAAPPTVCKSQSTTISANASGGTTSYTYAWTGATTSSSSSFTYSNSTSGTYTFNLTATDADGCTATGSTAVTVNGNSSSGLTVSVSTPNPTSVCPGSTTTLKATKGGGTGTITYTWTGSGTISPNGTTASNNTTATPTATGTYTVTATDGNGCEATATTTSVTVYSTPTVTASAVMPSKACNGTTFPLTATASGSTSPYSYAWSTVTEPTLTSVSFSPNSSTSANNSIGTISITGTAIGTNYQFIATVTDANGCTGSANTAIYTVSSSILTSAPKLSSASANVSSACAGSTQITLSATRSSSTTSPYTYTWSGPASTYSGTGNPYSSTSTTTSTTATPTSAAASGIYTVLLSDASGCTATANTGSVTINTPPAVTASTNTTSICNSLSDTVSLSSAVTLGSGTSITSYAWTSTTGGGLISPTTASTDKAVPTGTGSYTYTIKVTDNNNCTASGATPTVTYSSSPVVTAAAALASTACAGQLINLNANITTTTTSPYSYSWSSPSSSVVTPSTTINTAATTNTATATTTTTGNYIYAVQVTDNNGCIASAATNEEVIDTLPSASLSASSTTACANPATTINLTGSVTYATTSPYTYSWAGSGISNVNATTTTAIPTSTYLDSFKVTDANGCIGVGTLTVTVDQATPILSNPCNSTTPPLYSEVYDSYGYLWSWTFTTTTGDIFYTTSAYLRTTDSSTSHLQGPFIVYTGVYTVTNTDASGCIGTGSITVSACGTLLSANLLSFTAQKVQGTSVLNWATASELDNNYFGIERSADGISWAEIGTVNSLGNSQRAQNYTYTDALPLNGNNYYRLRIVDVNGRATYSDVKLVNFAGLWVVRMYPNPASNYLVLEFDNDKDEKANLIIETALGSKIFIKPQDIIKGHNVITLHQVQPLAQGTYFITLQTTTNMYRAKFVKGDSN